MVLFPCGSLPYNTPPIGIQGKYAEAEPLYERSQAIREKVLGLEHPDVAQSLNDRAGLFADQVSVASKVNFRESLLMAPI